MKQSWRLNDLRQVTQMYASWDSSQTCLTQTWQKLRPLCLPPTSFPLLPSPTSYSYPIAQCLYVPPSLFSLALCSPTSTLRSSKASLLHWALFLLKCPTPMHYRAEHLLSSSRSASVSFTSGFFSILLHECWCHGTPPLDARFRAIQSSWSILPTQVLFTTSMLTRSKLASLPYAQCLLVVPTWLFHRHLKLSQCRSPSHGTESLLFGSTVTKASNLRFIQVTLPLLCF